MKVAYIGTYPPRECGIGTFTQNLFQAVPGDEDSFVVAVSDHDLDYPYPPEVKFVINQDQQADYKKAAEFINTSGAVVCVLEHEYGIFGGSEGIYILSLLNRLEIPVVSTLHTVLEMPSYPEKRILMEICRLSEQVVVMSFKAIQFLTEIYAVPKRKIELIAHGVPDIHFEKEESKKELNLQDKKVLLTFGFVGRNKGIEVVIRALPEIIHQNPDVIYIVIGKTHPNVLRDSGEEYRTYLENLIKSMGLKNHVQMLNQFLDETVLFQYLAACDIYITPYLSMAQITSGTLTYAMGSGCAVVSTRFWHAAELLADDRGCFFEFNDSEGLAAVVNNLFKNPGLLRKIQKKATEYGRKITWPKIGNKYNLLFKSVLQDFSGSEKPAVGNEIDPELLPPFVLTHIRRLTDKTGILQHARFGIPDFKEGYCLDDNSRALLMTAMFYRHHRSSEPLDLMTVYLSFIGFMQKEDGFFHNFLGFNHDYLDKTGSEDSFGRTVWALGYLHAYPPGDVYKQMAASIFHKAVPNFEAVQSIRAVAAIIIGISYYLQVHPSDNFIKQQLRILTDKLLFQYEQNQSENWHWFEGLLAYDNAVLPLAMLHSFRILRDRKTKESGFASMEFLTEHTLKEGYLSLIGNEEWFMKNKNRSVFSQQPLDAQAMVLLFHQAYRLTGNRSYLKKLFTSFKWFLGENELHMSLYNFETHGCADGFGKLGINQNQGAESTLAYLISYLSVLKAYEDSFHYEALFAENS